jgi:methylmalonyl-CoA/ethylmalonyl-CoA epimerase
MIRGIKHIGIAVRDNEETLSFLRQTFGAEEITRTIFPELQQISSSVRVGEGCFELMEPISPDGAIGKFIESKGGGLHHISLLCDDVEAECDRLESQGLKVIGKMFDRPPKVAFLHPKSSKGILFELSERE